MEEIQVTVVDSQEVVSLFVQTSDVSVLSVNSQTGVVTLDPDDLDDTSTTNKFTTSANLTKLGFVSVTQAVDLDTIESDVALLNLNQISGVLYFETYADMIAASATGVSGTAYKVIADSDTSKNGDYSSDGTAYTQQTNAVNGVIEDGNVDAVSGGTVFDWDIVDKSSITDITGTLSSTILNADGTTTANGNWRTTEIIPIDANNGFLFNATALPGSPYASIIIYNSSDVIQEVIYSTDPKIGTIIFYDYDYKIQCCGRQTGADTNEIFLYTLLKNRVTNLEVEVSNNSIITAKVDANTYLDKTKTNYTFPNIGYINSSGAYIANVNAMTTDLLEIGDFYATYRFALAVLNASAINFYDEFTAWMSTESLVYSVDGIFTDRFIQIPTGAKYVRITSKSDYIETEVYTNIDNLEIAFNSLGNPNRFYQADAVNCGDSITWYDGNTLAGNQSGGTGGGEMCVGYIQTLARTLVFNSYDNQGASGKSMAVDNYVQISAYDYSAKDLVTIAHGTNDFKLNRSIGTIGSITDTTFDTATFYGAYRTVLNAIKTSNVDCEVFLITPIQRDNSGYTIEYTNSAGHKLIDYVNAIKELGEMYSLKVIDLYGESGINFYNVFSYTIDGLHPNNAGHLKMANSVLREIK